MPDGAADACWLPWPPEDCWPLDEVEDAGAIVTTDDVEEPVALPGEAVVKLPVPVVAVLLEAVDEAVDVADETADAYSEGSAGREGGCAAIIDSEPF
jgi:hypothetical protein